ncbi:hypothetical protein HPB52_022548 [Rhipicephalus sanguineus]|uniref:CRAL-TRIO domain-containing protein n=1 Tax=Rhipicephalus sanguineus TaxID=34632 RepID=A0A9D4PGS2_RHISA|nr:hypothetical protein HPB52_022548 [Rhipicephalus sanguineus]
MSRHFKLDRKRIREWEKNFDNLLQLNYGKAKLRQKLSNGTPVFSKHVDDAVFEYLERERSAGRAISNRILSEEAGGWYLMHTLDQFVESDYTLVYFHHGLSSKNKPSLGWLWTAFRAFDRKYKKNLKALYLVHPTGFVKILYQLFRPYISCAIFQP